MPPEQRPDTSGRITDARGRTVTQLDPVALHLLHRHDVIPGEELHSIAAAIDPVEVKRRPRAALLTPLWIAAWYAAFFGYFHIFNRWRGWDPVLVMFAAFYFLFPIAVLVRGFRKARRARWTRIGRLMLEYHHCPHCGYDLRGLEAGPSDGEVVCPECGCAWERQGDRER